MNHCANVLWVWIHGHNPEVMLKKHNPKQLITLRGKSKILVYTFFKTLIGNLTNDIVGNYHKFVSLYKKACQPDQ